MRLSPNLIVALLLAGSCCRVRVVDRVGNPASGEKPLDLFAEGAPDDNGLPLAPLWKIQREAGGVPDARALCLGADGRKISLDRCTTQKPVLDVAAGFADAICTLGTEHDIHGHANWWPVTYRGSLFWGEASIDLDYTFALRPEGRAALVSWCCQGAAPGCRCHDPRDLHVEFDSSETVRHFDTPWWNKLQAAAARGNADARSVVSGQKAVLTGLFGLDCEHECHSELHPVYLFALQVNDADADDTWAFFARNWGDEGFCSRYLHVLPIETVAIRIPWRCGARAVDLHPSTIVKKSPGVPADPRVTWAEGEGVVVEFDLPKPDPGANRLPRVHGELHLNWTMGGACPTAALSAPRESALPEEEEAENSAERRLEALPRPAELVREAAVPRDGVASTPSVKRVERLPPRAARTGSARVEEAAQKLRRDEDLLRARCQASRERTGQAPAMCDPVLSK